jgi:four helix bundle protein
MNRKHHALKTWQKAIELVNDIYLETRNYPKHELSILTAQMRRAGISIPSNIAEGAARNSDREFINFSR